MIKITVCTLLLAIVSGNVAAQQAPSEAERTADNPYARAEWDRLRLCDPRTNEIPAHARTNELAFARAMERDARAFKPASSRAGDMQIRSIGPRNVGGRTRALAIDRTNRDVMLTGGANGGIWRSIDAGASWLRVSENDDLQNITSIVQSDQPADGSVWYAGTGELLSTTTRRTSRNIRTLGTGTGIYRSVDRGVTWTVVRGTEVSTQPNSLGDPFSAVWKLERPTSTSDPAPDGLIATCYGGIYSLGAGSEPSITMIAGDSANPPFNTDVACTKRDAWFFGFSCSDAGTRPDTYGIWKYNPVSKSMKNISPPGLSPLIRRIVLAVAPSDDRIMYVFIHSAPQWAARYTSFGSSMSLWKYVDNDSGAGTWSNLDDWLTYVDLHPLAGYAMCLAVHPLDTNTVFIGGSSLVRSRSGFRNEYDGEIIGGYIRYNMPGWLHPDMHNVVFDANNPDKMFVACDGGVYSIDDSRTFETPLFSELNNGYVSTMAYGVSLDHDDDFVVAGFQDNFNWVTWSSDASEPWTNMGGGDGCTNAILPNRDVVFTTSQYGSTNALIRIGDVHDFAAVDVTPALASQTAGISFITNIKLSPDNGYLYMPLRNKLIRYPDPIKARDPNLDHKNRWEELTDVELNVPSTSAISAYAFSTQTPENLYAGTSEGNIFHLSTINGRTFVADVTGLNFPSNGFISSIDVDPRDDAHVIVSFSNYGVESIFLTTNGGESWTPFGQNLESDGDFAGWAPSVRCVKIIPDGDRTAYIAGTSVGLFSHVGRSSDVAWQHEGASTLGNIIVEALDYRGSDGRIAIGTHGAGIYIGETSGLSGAGDYVSHDYFALEQNVPNPASSTTTIRFNIRRQSHVGLSLYNAAGQKVMDLLESNMGAGRHSVTLAEELIDQLPSGQYYYRIVAGNEIATRAMTITK
ncbi:MAG: T9SS type A sorting domain-containing protein [bacterium]|nr:T9SS type A sorting domain-containing protein [Candidatus Kapabacteria bacterium]